MERANQTLVPPELLVEAIELLLVEMSFEERSVFDDSVLRLIDFLKAKGFSGRRHADLVVAIIFRASALAHLVHCDPLKGWVSAGGEEQGVIRLHAEVLRAAAEEPLVEDAAGATAAIFNVRSFMRRILLLAQAQGRA